MTHICVGKLTIIGSDNGLSPERRQAIIWTITGILLIEPLGTNFSEILIEINAFSFKKMHLKMSLAKWRPFCLSLNVIILSAELNLENSLQVINACVGKFTMQIQLIRTLLKWACLFAIWQQRSGSASAHVLVMACCLVASSNYLKQCWLIISEALWHSPEGNFT